MIAILQTLTLFLVLCWSCIQAQNAAFCPAPNGLFVNPNIRTCRSFIRCANGIGVIQRCRRGTVFSGQRCIPGNQQTCNRVNANHFNNAFGGPGATNPNIWSPGVVAQPGAWGTGVQPLPGLWNNNGQPQNPQWGFGGQGNPGNQWDNGSAAGWNDGGRNNRNGQIGGFNPGFWGAWFDGNLQRTGDGQRPVVDINNNNRPGRGQVRVGNWPNVNTNTGDNQTVQTRRGSKWP